MSYHGTQESSPKKAADDTCMTETGMSTATIIGSGPILSPTGATYQDLELCNDQRLAATQHPVGSQRTSVQSSEIQGDDQPDRVPLSSSSARPSPGRYLPKLNSKS